MTKPCKFQPNLFHKNTVNLGKPVQCCTCTKESIIHFTVLGVYTLDVDFEIHSCGENITESYKICTCMFSFMHTSTPQTNKHKFRLIESNDIDPKEVGNEVHAQ